MLVLFFYVIIVVQNFFNSAFFLYEHATNRQQHNTIMLICAKDLYYKLPTYGGSVLSCKLICKRIGLIIYKI